MSYGGIPIVRGTGGLSDTVEPLNEHGGNGYVFYNLDVYEVRGVLSASRRLYSHKELMTEIRTRNSKIDFSWQGSARNYIDTYKSLL